MKPFQTLALSLVTAVSMSAAAEFTPFTGPAVWDNYQVMPETDDWQWMYDDAEDIAADLNAGGGKYYLEYKMKGGSSHQTLVKRSEDDKVMGIFSAPNHATYLLGEIFAFHLSRLLERSDWATPAVRMTLSGQGRQTVYDANNVDLPSSKRSRTCNRDTILAYMDQNPYFIMGAYMAFVPGMKPEAVPNVVDREHKYRLNPDHFLVKMLRKDGPRPTGRKVYLKSGREYSMSYDPSGNVVAESTDIELVKQLSHMTLVDALNSQRDRFGPYGSNMEVMIRDNGTFTISLVDNGGIADSSNTSSHKYLLGTVSSGRKNKPVTRFEKSSMDRIIALDDFIKGNRSEFLGMSSLDEVKRALGYEDNPRRGQVFDSPNSCRHSHTFLFSVAKTRWDRRFKAFKNALDRVANHLRSIQNDPDAQL